MGNPDVPAPGDESNATLEQLVEQVCGWRTGTLDTT